MQLPDLPTMLWAGGLLVAYASLPYLVLVLTRIVVAAAKIYTYSRATHEHSSKLPEHLAALPALDDTAKLLDEARGTGVEIATGAEALAALLIRRAGGKS